MVDIVIVLRKLVIILLVLFLVSMPDFTLSEDNATLRIKVDSLPAAIYIDNKIAMIMNSFEMSFDISSGVHDIMAISPFKKKIERRVDVKNEIALNFSFEDALMELSVESGKYGCIINETDFYIVDKENPLRLFPGDYTIQCGKTGYYLTDRISLNNDIPIPWRKSKTSLNIFSDRNFGVFIDGEFFGIFNKSADIECPHREDNRKLKVVSPMMSDFHTEFNKDDNISVNFTHGKSILTLNSTEKIWFVAYEKDFLLAGGNGSCKIDLTYGRHNLKIYSPDKSPVNLNIELKGGEEKYVDINFTESHTKRGFGVIRLNMSDDISDYIYSLWLDNLMYACGNTSEIKNLPEGIYNIRLDFIVNGTLMKTLRYRNVTIEDNKSVILNVELENAKIEGRIKIVDREINASGNYILFIDGRCIKFIDGYETYITVLPGKHMLEIYGKYNGRLVRSRIDVDAGRNFTVNMSLRETRGTLKIKFDISDFNAMLLLNGSVEYLGKVKNVISVKEILSGKYEACIFAHGKYRYYPVNFTFNIASSKETSVHINLTRYGGDFDAIIYDGEKIYEGEFAAFFDDICIKIGKSENFSMNDVYPGQHEISVHTPHHKVVNYTFEIISGVTSRINISLTPMHALQIQGTTSNKRLYFASENFAEIYAFIYDEDEVPVLKGINVMCIFLNETYPMSVKMDRWTCNIKISSLKVGNYTYTIYAEGHGYSPASRSSIIKIRDFSRNVAIWIREPEMYSEVSGVVKVSVEVHLPSSTHMERIEIYSDRTLIGIISHKPYIYYWDTLDEKNGMTSLKAIIYGTTGSEVDEIVVYINNTEVPIHLKIVSPTQGEIVDGITDIDVNATGWNLTVSLIVDGEIKDEASSLPYHFFWDARNESEGIHIIEIMCIDIYGNKRRAVTYVIVKKPTESVEVIILEPKMWDVISGDCQIEGYVLPENATISAVELYVDDALINTSDKSQFLFILDTLKLRDGVHEIKLRVRTKDGGLSETPLKIIVKNNKEIKSDESIPSLLIVAIIISIVGISVIGIIMYGIPKSKRLKDGVKKDECIYTCPLCDSEFVVKEELPITVECPSCAGYVEVREEGVYEAMAEDEEVHRESERT